MFAALGNAFGAFALSVKCSHLDSFKVLKGGLSEDKPPFGVYLIVI
jgi:hypothetical protein